MSDYLILIIDDEPIQHMLLEDHLIKSGYGVAHAYNGAQGLEAIKKQKPDLILLDVQMPEMDGFETIEALRNNVDYADIPVLFLTSRESPYHKVRGLELGADDYITKPFHREELLARIRAVFRRAERYRRRGGDIDGDLANISIFDLLQNMETSGKTGTVSIEKIEGKIFIENGEIVHARQGDFIGNQALVRIFLLEKGSFFVNFGDIPARIQKIPMSLRSTLIGVLAEVQLNTDTDIVQHPNRNSLIRRIKETLRRSERNQMEKMMEGDISEVGLADLLQSMELGSKTASIALEEIDGEIFIENGLLIHVRQSNFTGINAFKRIFLLEKGRFSVRFDELPAKIIDEPQPLTSAMMAALAEVDEVRDVLRRTKVENISVKIDDYISEFPTIEKFKDQSPLPFIALLAMMDGNLKDNLSTLIQATKKGKLKKA